MSPCTPKTQVLIPPVQFPLAQFGGLMRSTHVWLEDVRWPSFMEVRHSPSLGSHMRGESPLGTCNLAASQPPTLLINLQYSSPPQD